MKYRNAVKALTRRQTLYDTEKVQDKRGREGRTRPGSAKKK